MKKTLPADDRFSIIADAAQDAMIMMDSVGRVSFWNDAAERVFGFEREEVLGEMLHDIVAPKQYHQIFQKAFRHFQINGTGDAVGKTLELAALKKDGTTFQVDLSMSAVNIGGKWHALGIIRDVTQKKEEQTRLTRYSEDLKRSNEELEQFASIASHDLQEPLRKIISFGDRVRERYADVLDETGKDYLKRMSSAAKRMQSMIDDLLMLSRITTRAQPFKPVNLTNIIKECISDLEIRIEKSMGKVEFEELPVIEADEVQMRQLFSNLISNGLKYHRPDIPPQIRIFLDKRDGMTINIHVSDNGIGFEKEYAEKVFLPFFRLHGRSQYEGSGIGLAICRKISERHKGKIEVRSEPEKGSVFTVTLPKLQEGENVK